MRDRIGYLHIPKTAGSSAADAIQRAVRSGADVDGPQPRMCPHTFDSSLFGTFDVNDLPEPERSRVFTGTPEDIASFDVVVGHFGAKTLESGRTFADLAVLFREPRARLLSLYTFWRSWSEEQHAAWGGYDISRHAVDEDWPEFLEDPSVAAQTDNIAARLILAPHPLIPPGGFIKDSAVPEVTREALATVAQFGHADVIENGDACWERLGDWADLSLEIGRRNPTPLDRGPEPDWGRIADSEVLRSLDHRTRIDQQLWVAAAARHADGIDEISRRADGIAAAQVAKVLDRAKTVTLPRPDPSRVDRAAAAWRRVARSRRAR